MGKEFCGTSAQGQPKTEKAAETLRETFQHFSHHAKHQVTLEK